MYELNVVAIILYVMILFLEITQTFVLKMEASKEIGGKPELWQYNKN